MLTGPSRAHVAFRYNSKTQTADFIMKHFRFSPDPMTMMLLGMIALASFFPATGAYALAFDRLSTLMIAVLFFMHGARLSREAVVAGMMHWRLHLLVLGITFVLFPVLGLVLRPVLEPLVTPEIYLGILYLCVLPSTVQSSIAFTSVARGNVSAAVCSASASNILGIFITPVLVSLIVKSGSGVPFSWEPVLKIVVQLLLPFVAGQLLRPLIRQWVDRWSGALKKLDQSSILLVVYVAFGEAVVQGIWQRVPLTMLLVILMISALLLTIIMLITTYGSRRLGFSKEDEITIVFCGSKKSLASGVPMAKVLFAGGSAGLVLLPIMLFHQLQLMVCTVLAQRYANRKS